MRILEVQIVIKESLDKEHDSSSVTHRVIERNEDTLLMECDVQQIV